jgi:capsular polysaccharide biosynthesis protein
MDDKNDPLLVGDDVSGRQAAAVCATRLIRKRVWKAAALMAAIGLMPFGAWLVGSGIVLATPPVYQSGAILRVDASPGAREEIRREVARLKSDSVVGPAAQSLTRQTGRAPADPMSAYLLWSSLSVKEQAGPNLIKLEVRSSAPGEARRIVMAVVEAYERNLNEATSAANAPARLVYVDPLDMLPSRVAAETRMMLGLAGMALLGLLLCIPLLRRLELAMPMKGRGQAA